MVENTVSSKYVTPNINHLKMMPGFLYGTPIMATFLK
jgi:hypothetical protein